MLMVYKSLGDHDRAAEAMKDLRIMFEYLDTMDRLQDVSFNLSLERGLDYYNGIIYKTACI